MTDRDRADPPQSDAVRAALAGELPLAALSTTERRAANLELDRLIRERAGTVSFAEILLAEATTIVVLDDGHLTEHRPDGSIKRVRSGS